MQPTDQERIELTPIDGIDPEDMPTQRFRIDDLDPTDRVALLESIRRLDEADAHAALDLEVTLDSDGHAEIDAPAVPSPPVWAQPTPALAFGVGFGVVALIQVAWWLLL